MSEISPAKVRIEIFREPLLFHDHWYNDWTITGSGSKTDDEIILNSATAYAEHPISYDTGTYEYIIVRVTKMNATWAKIEGFLSGTAKWSYTYYSAGFKEEKVSIQYSGPIDKLRVSQNGTGEIRFDYIIVTKYSTVIPTDSTFDVTELDITNELVNNKISGVELVLRNPTGEYTSNIKTNDNLIIWLARSESNIGKIEKKVFGGKISLVEYSSRGYGTTEVKIQGESHAYELIKPPALVQEHYESVNGRTIIEDCIDSVSYLTYSQIPSNWFDNTGSSGSTDDRINSTHSAEWDEEIPHKCILEILERAANPSSVRGFDIYEYPSGVLRGHLKDSEDFKTPRTLSPENYSKSNDIHRVVNKIKIYGAAEKAVPQNMDDWTDSLSNWTAGAKTTIGLSDLYILGSHSIYGFCNQVDVNVKFYRSGLSVDCDYPREDYKKLVFWYRYKTEDPGLGMKPFRIRIYLANSMSLGTVTSGFVYHIPDDSISSRPDEWRKIELSLGREEEGPTSEGKWEKIGSGSWKSISYFMVLAEFENTSPPQTYKGYFYVEALYFYGARFSSVIEDSVSQGKYGIRYPKPTVDNSLLSDAECQAEANSQISFWKDIVITLEDLQIDGDETYIPGNIVWVEISQENISEYFRIVSVEHKVSGSVWDTFITLSNEPQYVDYVIRLLRNMGVLLERRR